MIKILQLLSLFAVISMLNGVSAKEEKSSVKESDDKFVFSCQRALEAKGGWKRGSNCRGPAGDIISDVVYPESANVEIKVEPGIKK